jgi:hypothetical protein
VTGCKTLAQSKGWPVDTAVMSAQELNFPNNNSIHSFTSFAFHCLGDQDIAAKQVHRTMKPGDTALVSIWTYMPHVNALQHGHWRTRGKEGPKPVLLPREGFQEKDLVKALRVGGFDNIDCHKKDFFVRIPDLKQWAQLA